MSANNGVIRIGRKGRKKFAFGDDGAPFEVDIVDAMHEWIRIDDDYRPVEEDAQGNRPIPTTSMQEYHRSAVAFVEHLAGESYNGKITRAEALDFLARLREQYDELASFFRPKSLDERASPDTSEPVSELRFSTEPEAS